MSSWHSECPDATRSPTKKEEARGELQVAAGSRTVGPGGDQGADGGQERWRQAQCGSSVSRESVSVSAPSAAIAPTTTASTA